MTIERDNIIENANKLNEMYLQAQEDAINARALNARLTDENIALTEALAICEGGTPPPPVHIMRLGATTGEPMGSGMSPQMCIDAWQNGATSRPEYGVIPHGPLGCRRVFSRYGFAPAPVNMQLDFNVRDSCMSFKGSTIDVTAVNAFLDSLPDDGFRRYVTWQHEAERPDKGNTPAWFKAGIAKFGAIVDTWNEFHPRKQPVIKTIVNMSWLDRDPDLNSSTQDWWPDIDLSTWVLGLDPYDEGGKPFDQQSLQALVTPTLKTWFARGGKRWFVAEYGTKRTGQAGADAIRTNLQWAFDNGCEQFMWFQSYVGTKGPWWLNDPTSVREWAGQAARFNAVPIG